MAGIGWVAVYPYADADAPDLHPLEPSLAWLIVGILSYLGWTRQRREWPFGPRRIEERYRDAGRAGADPADEALA